MERPSSDNTRMPLEEVMEVMEEVAAAPIR